MSLSNNKINIMNTEHKNKEIINERKINQISSKNSENLNIEKSYELKLNRGKTNKKLCIIDSEENNNKNYINEIKKKINCLYIIKSFFCFNDKKTKLVDRCYNIILEDTSIERILERFYNLENAYHFISYKNNEKLLNDNENLKEISNFIDKIYHEEKSQKEITGLFATRNFYYSNDYDLSLSLGMQEKKVSDNDYLINLSLLIFYIHQTYMT